MTLALQFQLPFNVVVLGILTGLAYALLGVGITVTYKTSRAFNMAIGQMGALAALVLPVLAIGKHLSYWLALPAALLVAAGTGAFTELVVVRKLARSPRLVVLVATLGLAQLFFTAEVFLPTGGLGSHLYPVPFHTVVNVGTLHLSSGYLLVLVVVPVVVLGTTLFLQRTTIGLASRAAAENEDAAFLVGIPVRRVSLAVWTLSGLLAGVAAVLMGPTQMVGGSPQLVGPSLLLRALAAALVGGLSSLPQVFAGGVVIGVLEAVVRYNYPAGGTVDIVMLGVVVASLLARRQFREAVRSTAGSAWSLTGRRSGLPEAVLRAPAVRRARLASRAVLGAAALLLPLVLTNGARVQAATTVVYALMGLSIVVLVGWCGQVSLGQFAFVELGALAAGRLAQQGYPLWLTLAYVVGAGAVAALVLGLPALRVKGEFLAVTTLGFAVASQTWLPQQSWLVNASSERLVRPRWFGVDWSSELRYYWLCLAVLGVGLAVAGRIRSGGLGRRLMAVRDNERAAASLGVPPRQVKLVAFLLAGALAAGAGFFYGGLLGGYSDPNTFQPAFSLSLVAFVVLGGVTYAGGAVAGAVLVYGLAYVMNPVFEHHVGADAGVVLSGIGLLGAVLQYPEGILGAVGEARDRWYRRLAGTPSAGSGPPAVAEEAAAGGAEVFLGRSGLTQKHLATTNRSLLSTDGDQPALECRDVVVRYGGHVVLDGVSLTAAPGEVVGLVGPNGAGKTTLFDVLSGQQAPAAGRVHLGGRDVTALPPERRAALGLARTFQQARLFEGLSVLDCVKVALECAEPTEAVPALLGLPPARSAERRKDARAREVVDLLGLGPYSHLLVPELSTGMRRLVEIATVVALGGRTLLLDEPTAGVAQREVEAFARVLRDVQAHLGATVVLIEHDLPLVTGVSDRMYVLAAGRVIAEGRPAAVREDPAVVAAYLGTDERVILRSGAPAAAGSKEG